MQVLLLESIEDIEGLFAIELEVSNPLLPLLLSLVDAEGVVVIVSLDRVLEHLSDSALGVLVAPQLAQFLQVQVHVEL